MSNFLSIFLLLVPMTTPNILKIVLTILATLYCVFSLWYIGQDIWTDYAEKGLAQAFVEGQRLGQRSTLEEIIAEAKGSECRPFSVFTEDQAVQLVNAECS